MADVEQDSAGAVPGSAGGNNDAADGAAGAPPSSAAASNGTMNSPTKSSSSKAPKRTAAEEAGRKRELMLKFRDSLRGPVLQKLYSEEVVGPSTSYEVEQWVRVLNASRN